MAGKYPASPGKPLKEQPSHRIFPIAQGMDLGWKCCRSMRYR